MKKRFKPLHQSHEPIPGEILHRMTKPKEEEPMYQAFVEARGGDLIPFTPVAAKDFVEFMVEQMQKAILAGKQPDVTNPHLVRVLAL